MSDKPKSKYATLRPHRGAGVFSLFNAVITCLEIYERVEVNWPPKDTPYKAAKCPNLWAEVSMCFENPLLAATHKLLPEQRKEADALSTYPHFNYTGRNAGWLYLHHDGWRERLHRQFKKITLSPVIETLMEIELHSAHDTVNSPRFNLEGSIGILYRGAKNVEREQLSGRTVPVEHFVRRANAINKTAPIFLACDNEEDVNEFCTAFGERLWIMPNVDRALLHGSDPHHEKTCFDEWHVQRIFAQTVALSRCAHLIHGVSNMATAALYMTPSMEHTFLQIPPLPAPAK